MLFSLETWTAIFGGSFIAYLAGKVAVAGAEEWIRGAVRHYQDRRSQSKIELSRHQLVEMATRNRHMMELALMALNQRDEALRKLEKTENLILGSTDQDQDPSQAQQKIKGHRA